MSLWEFLQWTAAQTMIEEDARDEDGIIVYDMIARPPLLRDDSAYACGIKTFQAVTGIECDESLIGSVRKAGYVRSETGGAYFYYGAPSEAVSKYLSYINSLKLTILDKFFDYGISYSYMFVGYGGKVHTFSVDYCDGDLQIIAL